MMNLDEIELKPGLSGFRAGEVIAHRDHAMMKNIHELRFQVYCLEQGFLDAIDYPDGAEVDEHDERARHFACHDTDGEVAGYVRLVHADASGAFPYQRHGLTLHAGIELPSAHQSAEISRLMVRACYRRQPDRSPDILCTLFRLMYERSIHQDIRFWYAAMERSLARVLQRLLGVEFKQIGPVTDYYGPVAPYLIDVDEVAMQLREIRPGLMRNLDVASMCA